MKKTTKVLLAIGAFVVIVPVGVIIAVVLYVRGNRERFLAEGRKLVDEAVTFGRQHSNEECEVEALERNSRCGFGNLVCEVEAKVFFQECLRSSAPNETTCEGVPRMGEILSSADWLTKRCAMRGKSGNASCTRVLQALQDYCGRR